MKNDNKNVKRNNNQQNNIQQNRNQQNNNQQRNNQQNNKSLDRKDVTVDSFKAYKSSDNGKTKEVDGEKELESFHMYKEADDEDDDNTGEDAEDK